MSEIDAEVLAAANELGRRMVAELNRLLAVGGTGLNFVTTDYSGEGGLMADRVHCDRCHQDKEGFVKAEGSAGCYIVADDNGPTYWAKYAERCTGERVICDDCMWSTPTYVATYGDPRK